MLNEKSPSTVYYSMAVGALNRVDISSSLSRLLSADTISARSLDNNQAGSIADGADSDLRSLPSSSSAVEKPTSSDQTLKSDTVDISSEARRLSKLSSNKLQSKPGSKDEATDAAVNKLKAVDREVRAHERAHLAAAGGLARGGASFKMTRGPDGHFYAVAGEVQIDTSPVPGDPDATIRKAETVRKAALAPAKPSSQDSAVAAAAGAMEAEARAEKARNKNEGGENETKPSSKISFDTIRTVTEANAAEPGSRQSARKDDSKRDAAVTKIQQQFDPVEALGTILSLIA